MSRHASVRSRSTGWGPPVSTATLVPRRALLLWVTIKPFVRPSPAWLPKPSVQAQLGPDAAAAPAFAIGVALEHNTTDAEILNRALAWPRPQNRASELTLLHVVDTAMTRVLGPETADRESDADERYLADVVDALRERGYQPACGVAAWAQSRRRAGWPLRHDPVDLLVVGSHGHGMVRDLLLGQTVDRVRHRLEVPMLIARPDRDSTLPGPDTPVRHSAASRPQTPRQGRLRHRRTSFGWRWKSPFHRTAGARPGRLRVKATGGTTVPRNLVIL